MLFIVVKRGKWEYVKRFFDLGLDLNEVLWDVNFFIFLMFVVICSIMDFVEFFINKGVDVNVKDRFDMIVFYFVLLNGRVIIVLVLIEVGFRVNDVIDRGMMLLYFVC